MSKFRGLPQDRKMRHDSHFVEEITSTRSESIGRLIDIDRIEPNPNQPRKNFGDLNEMVASIKEKGILEPILVRIHEGKFQIIAGERRYQAAKIAGLRHLPCIEVDVDHRGEQVEIGDVDHRVCLKRGADPFVRALDLQRAGDHAADGADLAPFLGERIVAPRRRDVRKRLEMNRAGVRRKPRQPCFLGDAESQGEAIAYLDRDSFVLTSERGRDAAGLIHRLRC